MWGSGVYGVTVFTYFLPVDIYLSVHLNVAAFVCVCKSHTCAVQPPLNVFQLLLAQPHSPS